MIKYFRCPNGDVVPVEQCLEHCDHRCLFLPTLKFSSRTRKWDGKTFSVTQLLQPTLHEYLKLTEPETVSPMSTLQAGLGTAGHALMEGNMPRNAIGEFRMIDSQGKITGQPDLVMLKEKMLCDFKFVASYSLAMMLGMKKVGYWHEFTRGKRKGEREWRYRYESGGTPDYHGYDKQLNMYRILLQQNGIQINKMVLQAVAKESDAMLKQLGLDRRAYLIELPKYDDDELLVFFYGRYNALKSALDTQTMPPMCDDTWNGRRCRGYCSVNTVCPYYKGETK